MTVCRGITDSGERCRSAIGIVDGLCAAHDPARREELRERARAGGRATAKRNAMKTLSPEEIPNAPQDADDARQLLSWATRALLEGKIDRHTAHELGYLGRAFLEAVDRAGTSERIARLEDQLRDLKGISRAAA